MRIIMISVFGEKNEAQTYLCAEEFHHEYVCFTTIITHHRVTQLFYPIENNAVVWKSEFYSEESIGKAYCTVYKH